MFNAVGSQEHPSHCSALLGTRAGEARIELVERAAASMRGGERAVRDLQLFWLLGSLAVGGVGAGIAVPMLALGNADVRSVGGSVLGVSVAIPVFFAARVALLPRNLRAPAAFARAWPVPLVAGGPGVGVAGTF